MQINSNSNHSKDRYILRFLAASLFVLFLSSCSVIEQQKNRGRTAYKNNAIRKEYLEHAGEVFDNDDNVISCNSSKIKKFLEVQKSAMDFAEANKDYFKNSFTGLFAIYADRNASNLLLDKIQEKCKLNLEGFLH